MFRNRSGFIGCTALAAVALAACEGAGPLEPESMLRPVFSNSVAGRECFTTNFNSFTHGDFVTTLSVPLAGGVSLTLSGERFRDGVPQRVPTDLRIYDTEMTPPFANPTHEDTQKQPPGFCVDCEGGMLVVPATPDNWDRLGMATRGGSMVFTGFSAVEGTWELGSVKVVDGDTDQAPATIFADGTLIGMGSLLGNGTVETVVPDAHVINDELEIVHGDPPETGTRGGSGGIDDLQICFTPPPPGGGEGCTPGYWKQSQHFDSWPAPYLPTTLFDDVFNDAFPGMTLVQMLDLGGGGLKALGRQAVAALLGAASPDVSYDMTAAQVIAAFNAALASGEYEAQKDIFDRLNNQGCPLN